MLIAQNIPRVRGDAFDAISCLTAVNLDGKVLWQTGRPDPRNGLLTNDTPFQIHDVDGDGRNEVVLVRDFKLQILDGRTGKVKRSAWMPAMRRRPKERPYDLSTAIPSPSSTSPATSARREILVKDRYRYFWVYNNNLKLLWKGEGQTGHYPYPCDIDGDGRDEIAIGYALWDHDGKQLWSHDAGPARPRRRHRDGQPQPGSEGRAARLRQRQRRRLPHVRRAGQHPEARARRPQPEPQRSASSARTCPGCSTSP